MAPHASHATADFFFRLRLLCAHLVDSRAPEAEALLAQDLDIAIVKATNHDDVVPKEKHVRSACAPAHWDPIECPEQCPPEVSHALRVASGAPPPAVAALTRYATRAQPSWRWRSLGGRVLTCSTSSSSWRTGSSALPSGWCAPHWELGLHPACDAFAAA